VTTLHHREEGSTVRERRRRGESVGRESVGAV